MTEYDDYPNHPLHGVPQHVLDVARTLLTEVAEDGILEREHVQSVADAVITKLAEQDLLRNTRESYFDVVFEGQPGPHTPVLFVEIEDADGRSISSGGWIDRGNGWWAARVPCRPGGRGEIIPREFSPRPEDLHVHQSGNDEIGYLVTITHVVTQIIGQGAGDSPEAAQSAAQDDLRSNVFLRKSRLRSMRGNPVIREIWRHNSDGPQVIWVAAIDAHGNVHRVPLREGDPLFAVLANRHEELNQRISDLRIDHGLNRS